MTLPVTILTGFLGSGKTTLLNRLLRRPELGDTAVIINEFGEVGIDHLLVEHVDEHLRVLTSGCLCCTVRGDLVDTLGTLLRRRAAGTASFSRVIIETTGLADPAPVMHTLMADVALNGAFHLDGVVTAVDAVNAGATLACHVAAVKQVGVADVLLMTKSDLVDAAALQALAADLHRINPGAKLHRVDHGEASLEQVFGVGWVDPEGPVDALPDALHGHAHGSHHHDASHHGAHVSAHAFIFDTPLPRDAFQHWLELLAAMRGERLLRVKGLVCLVDDPGRPLVVHGVQHVLHPPRRLDAWPSADRRTRLVFIVDDMAREDIARTFRKFVPTPETSTP